MFDKKGQKDEGWGFPFPRAPRALVTAEGGGGEGGGATGGGDSDTGPTTNDMAIGSVAGSLRQSGPRLHQPPTPPPKRVHQPLGAPPPLPYPPFPPSARRTSWRLMLPARAPAGPPRVPRTGPWGGRRPGLSIGSSSSAAPSTPTPPPPPLPSGPTPPAGNTARRQFRCGG